MEAKKTAKTPPGMSLKGKPGAFWEKGAPKTPLGISPPPPPPLYPNKVTAA